MFGNHLVAGVAAEFDYTSVCLPGHYDTGANYELFSDKNYSIFLFFSFLMLLLFGVVSQRPLVLLPIEFDDLYY